MRVHAGDAGLGGSRSHTSGDGLVIGKWLSGTRVNSTDGEVVHGASSRGGNSVGDCLSQRAQQYVDNALRGLPISARDGGWWACVDDRSLGRDYFDRAHQSRGGGHVFCEQTAEHVEAS